MELDLTDYHRLLEQRRRKQEYNKVYYQQKTKPKKEICKQNVYLYEEQIAKLEYENRKLREHISSMISEVEYLKIVIEKLRIQNHQLSMKTMSVSLPNVF